MAKLGLEGFTQHRKFMIILGTVIVVALPMPFALSWLDSLSDPGVKNFRGIPIAWHSFSAIKIRHRKISRIPIKYTRSTHIPVAYHDLSVIKITYRNGANSGPMDDPRFHIVRVRSTTFKVSPLAMLLGE